MFRLERPQNDWHSLLSNTAGAFSQARTADIQHQKKTKEIHDLLGPLNEDSSPFEWMRAIQSLRHADPEEKKQLFKTIQEVNSQKESSKRLAQATNEKRRQEEEAKALKDRQTATRLKLAGMQGENPQKMAEIQGQTGQVQPTEQKLPGGITEEEFAELDPADQRALLKPKAPVGGLSGLPVSPEVQKKINEVLDTHKYASPERLRQALNTAEVPRGDVDRIVEDRREEQKVSGEKSTAQEARIDRSYTRHKDFIDNTTKAHRSWITRDKPKLQQMNLLTDKDLISPTAERFMEIMGLPISLLGNPDSEVFSKLSQDLLSGLPETFGSRILQVEVQNFLKTIPTLSNSPQGRKQIIGNLLMLGRMKEDMYEEMRRQEEQHLRNEEPLPLDFDRKVIDAATPRVEKTSRQFVELGNIGDEKPGHTVYFDDQDRAVWVPNTIEDRNVAERSGYTPAYISYPGAVTTPRRSPPQETQPETANQELTQQEQQTPPEEQPSGEEFDEPYYEPVSEYVDPNKQELREEGTLAWGLRNTGSALASAGAAIAGAPGDLWKLGELFGSTQLQPYIRDIFGDEAYERLHATPTPLPTSAQLKEGIDYLTGGKTAPKTKNEERFQELTGDVAAAAVSLPKAGVKAGIKAGRKLATVFFSPVAANAGKIIAEEVGASPNTSNAVKTIVGVSVALAGLISGKKYANKLMNQGRNGFGPYDAANSTVFTKELKDFQRKMLKSDPASSYAYEMTNELIQDVKEGKTSMKNLMGMYDAVNRKKRDAGLFNMQKTDRNLAKSHLDNVNKLIRNQINQVGKSNPGALNAWTQGVSAHAVIHQTEWMGRLAESYITSSHLQTVAPSALKLLFTGGVTGLLGPKVGGVGATSVAALSKMAQVMARVYQHKELANYYFSALSDLAKRNQVGFSQNYQKLSKEYKKKYPNEDEILK